MTGHTARTSLAALRSVAAATHRREDILCISLSLPGCCETSFARLSRRAHRNGANDDARQDLPAVWTSFYFRHRSSTGMARPPRISKRLMPASSTSAIVARSSARLVAAAVELAKAVRWPILRPGRASRLP